MLKNGVCEKVELKREALFRGEDKQQRPYKCHLKKAWLGPRMEPVGLHPEKNVA